MSAVETQLDRLRALIELLDHVSGSPHEVTKETIGQSAGLLRDALNKLEVTLDVESAENVG